MKRMVLSIVVLSLLCARAPAWALRKKVIF